MRTLLSFPCQLELGGFSYLYSELVEVIVIIQVGGLIIKVPLKRL